MNEWLQLARVMLAGAFAFMCVSEAGFYLMRRDRHHLWSVVATVLVTTYMLARYASHGDVTTDVLFLALRVESASGLLLAAVALRIMARLTSSRWQVALSAVTGFAVVLAVVSMVEGGMFHREFVVVQGLGGLEWVAAVTSSLGWTLRAMFIAAFIFSAWAVGGELKENVDGYQLKLARYIGFIIVAAVLNDRFAALGVFRTVELMEVAMTLVGFAIFGAQTQITTDVFHALEAQVEERTQELRQMARSLNDLLTGLPDIVLVFRPDGVQLLSDVACSRWGASRDDRIGLAQLGARPHDVEQLRLLAEGGGTSLVRVELRDGEGVTFPCEISSVPVVLDGVELVVATARDVSEREALEQRLRLTDRLATVGTMAAGIAHEINNPLTFISSNIVFVRNSFDARGASELVEALDDASQGVDRVAAIVQELRRFGRADGAADAPTSPLDGSLNFALRLTRHTLRHSCDVITRVPEQLPEVVGDDGRLSQVFVNLLTNAADAMPAGRGAHMNCVVVEATVEQAHVDVVIRDNGRGMTSDQLQHIYDPFFTTKGVDSGMGLGLSICRNIVDEVGGSITIESEVHVGTTVTVRLMRASSRAPTRTTQVAPVPKAARRVLVIDDEPQVLRAMKRLLSRTHDVTTQPLAAQAIELFERGETYDAILCDMMMPEMTGYEFLLWLREHHPEQATRLAIVTGGAVGDEHAAHLEEVDVPVLRKPLSYAEFQSAIERLATR